MGTFHDDKGELHGITVVVRTHGPRIYVGRCDTRTEQSILLLDADSHDDGQEGLSNAQFLANVAQWGHWPRIKAIEIPAKDIAAVARLAELA
ncbi:MAG: hypothetical protein IPP14_09375 [Planctomycetes bacterium]|nr:hypothetical protein [Planctomycetota bacterium]